MNTFEERIRSTRKGFLGRLSTIFTAHRQITEELLDEIEEILLSSDLGLETTRRVVDALLERVKTDKYLNKEQLIDLLKSEIYTLLPEDNTGGFPLQMNEEVHTILLVGVNGVGKTTTAARIAYGYQKKGASVILGAADTFRAAAIDQLQTWGHRLGIEVVAKSMGSDPGAVAYETLIEAKRRRTQVAIIDTAGRLHNKKHLMEELAKIRRVMAKAMRSAPHEVLLVLDASTGQNAFAQTEAFLSTTQVTGFVLTKLDGMSKGGVLLGVSSQYQIPVQYLGIGEQLSDLRPFDRTNYIESVLLDE